MQLREKSKHISGELGMSSMTDILFILLMFFMMISALAAPSALNLQLPGKSNKANRLTENSRLPDVAISAAGSYRLNGKAASIEQIVAAFQRESANKGSGKANVIVTPDENAPVESVVTIMDAAVKNGVIAVLNIAD